MIRLYASGTITPAEIREREQADSAAINTVVAEIIADVRKRGDAAVLDYTARFDRAKLSTLLVAQNEIDEAMAQIDPAFLDILRQAKDNICAYHEKQRQHGYVMGEQAGVILGQRVLPLDRAGLYIPGGTASYPSSVLMSVLPAKIAGVKEIILATPPAADGSIAPARLAAAHIAGVDRIYKMGGAQAIAALAYGTKSVPRVDKITGPGNIFVATAKQMVYGQVDIDMIAGPSEILVIADDSANARNIAADMLSQAEHDALAASILLTTSKALAQAVQAEIETQLAGLLRNEIARQSIDRYGCIVVTNTLEEAAEISNEIAPEHLEICTNDPFALLGLIRHAGSIFLGHNTPEALGDYLAGPNHTLPTNGTARFSSPLGVEDFVKKSSFLYYSREALCAVAPQVAAFARQEGLEGHARSTEIRFEEK